MDVREILHHLTDAVFKPDYEQAGAPTADDLHKAIDTAYGYVPPEPALSADEENTLNALLAKQRAVDEAKATTAAQVDHTADE